MAESEVLCVGELLWDSLPAGLFLGGAPFNVACHLRATGVPVAMVSRVGHDRLGEEALRRAARYGVGTDLVQVDESLPTGFVRVAIDESGNAAFEILEPAAWDAIAASDELLERAARARAIVFGTLAQRHATTRATIESLWASPALKVFDLNLRPPYVDRDVVRRSLAHADVVKLAEGELDTLAGWLGLGADLRQRATALAERFECGVVCVTRGARGAVLWHDGAWSEHPGFEVEVRDTVGAGDAFLAVLVAGLLAGTEDATNLRNANMIGAYVATQPGALPSDQPSAIEPAAAAVTPVAASRRRGRARGRRP